MIIIKTALVITSSFPDITGGGAGIRVSHDLEILKKNFKIVLYIISRSKIKYELVEKLENQGIQVIVRNVSRMDIVKGFFISIVKFLPLHVSLYLKNIYKSEIDEIVNRGVDLIFCIYSPLAIYSHDKKKPCVVDHVDALSLNFYMQYKSRSGIKKYLYRIESMLMKKYEKNIMRISDYNFFSSNKDITYTNMITSHQMENKVGLLPNCIDVEYFKYKRTVQANGIYKLLFIGNLDYYPNIQAANLLLKDIFPKLKKRIRLCKLYIVGNNPLHLFENINSNDIEVTGRVDDVRPYYQEADVFVAPIFIATGTQNKILEAACVGTPIVTTNIVKESLYLKDDSGIVGCDNVEEMIDKIAYIVTDELQKKSMSEKTFNVITSAYSIKAVSNQVLKKIEMIV